MTTSKFSFIFLFVSFLFTANGQHSEMMYHKNSDHTPIWVKMMHQENADPGEVSKAYNEYYANNKFVKNGHTQYYKRWIRSMVRDINGANTGKRSIKDIKKEEQAYIERSKALQNNRQNVGTWECLGPIDFDKEAEGRSYAAGAAHVYTVEQSVSNPDVLYAGTASAGLWKSIDHGDNWTLCTRDLMVNSIRSIEIDHANPEVVYFNASGGSVYKSTDGGTTWTELLDPVISEQTHNANDIVMHPSDNSILFLSSERGFFKTSDAGQTWEKVLAGNYQELEFHPTNSNILYLIKQVDNRTEFYKSTDGGDSFQIKGSGWPGINSLQENASFNALALDNAFVDIGNTIELGAGAYSDFTIEIKVKMDTNEGDPALLSNKNWSSGFNKGFVISSLDNGNWKFNIGDGSNRIDLDGGYIGDGQWHSLSITYDKNGEKKIYQNGVLLDESSVVLNNSTFDEDLKFMIGQDGTGNYQFPFKGELAELRIWDTALTAEMIFDFNCQSNVHVNHPNRSALKHYWTMDQNAGNNVMAAVGNSNGAINGTSDWMPGNSIQCITSDLDADEEQRRTEIAVTAANPNKIYALATGSANGGSGLYGIYVSEDAGESWTFKCCGPQPSGPAVAGENINMMGWADDGSDDGGQYYYDLALDVSPTDENKVFVAGVNLWISDDGGDTFVCPSKWSHSGKVNYVHADIHDVRYIGDEIWVACDGGIFFSDDNAAVFQRKMKGIAGTDFWGFGAGFLDGEVMVGGTYHNGTLLKDHDVYENGWISTRGGDNIRGFVNFGNPRIVYDDGGKRGLPGDRTKPFIGYTFGKKPNASYVTGESSNLAYNARCYNIVYTGFETGIWKSEDDGTSWDLLYDLGENVAALEISRTDPNVLYACTYIDWWGEKRIYRSTDAGLSWENITPLNLFEGGYWPPIDVAISSTDPMKIWIARAPQSGGYNPLNGSKVFKSNDGGESWENLSTPTLDDEHLTNIEYQRGTEGGVYLGTRRAVYYRNDNMDDWELYNAELPVSTYSTKLIPYYWDGKIRNGTNRSVYECNFFEPSKPEAQIAADRLTSYCTRDNIQFIDHSALFNEGATWSWSFPGGIPATSNERHPVVVYPNAGSFDVSLTVTDVNGTDSQTIENFITVTPDCDPQGIPGNAGLFDDEGGFVFTDRIDLGSTNSMTMSAWVRPNGVQNDYTGIVTASDGNAFGFNFRPNMELGYHWPNGLWYWSSGLYIPENEWSHVAIVTEPTGITLYLNGVGVKHEFEPGEVQTTAAAFHIGSYLAWESRNFDGLIDEVCIWDRPLTEEEIRLGMHLTKNGNDPALKAYFQFNAAGGPVSDRIGLAHANFTGGASRTFSSAPVGAGASEAKRIDGPKRTNFLDRAVALEFDGESPQGEVVVSRIEVDPDQYPNDKADPGYWVVHNFGNQNATQLRSLLLGIPDVSEDDLQFTPGFVLHHRSFNDEEESWNYKNLADQVYAGENGYALYNDVALPFGQLSISREKIIRKDDEEFTTSSEKLLPADVSVYPNPLDSKNLLNVKTNNLGSFDFSIYDVNGKLLKTVQLIDEGQVDLSKLQPGNYFFQLVSSRKIQNGAISVF